jgi:hypothetical protein
MIIDEEKEKRRKKERKKNKILAKNADMTQKHIYYMIIYYNILYH